MSMPLILFLDRLLRGLGHILAITHLGQPYLIQYPISYSNSTIIVVFFPAVSKVNPSSFLFESSERI